MNYKKTTLKNGLRIITVPMKNTETVAVVIMVGVGSRYESEREAGLSHFIEHMFFKGTKKRPNTLAISSELDAVGGEFNAFTSKDKTMYYAKVDAKHIGTALDVVADMYLNSKIDEKEIEKEKGTIIQELNMYEDLPMNMVADVFEKMLYDKNPLGRAIIGYKNTLASFKRKNFLDYMNRFYVANDTAVCVAGKFNEKEVLKKIRKYFEKMPKKKKPQFKKITEKQSKPAVKIKFKKTDQTHLLLGARAYHQDHKDRFALGLMGIILGGNMSSRLFTEVREKRGLAYYVSSGAESFHDCGYFASRSGVEHKNLERAVKIIIEEYRKIASQKVSEKELQMAKDFIKGKSIMGMEESDAVALFFLEQEILKGKILKLEEIFEKFDKVTREDILRVAKDIFRNYKLNLAVIGPHKDGKKLEKILKF